MQKFVHGESRPVDGIPDPHYHIHVFAMNATFDEVEKEWKALEVGNTVGDRTFYEAHLHHLLAARLDLSGYGIRRNEQHFEFASVSRELVDNSAGERSSSSSGPGTKIRCWKLKPGRSKS